MLKLIRYIQQEPELWSNQIHGYLKIRDGNNLKVYQTLERPRNENRPETSCLKAGIYKFDIINPTSEFPFIQLRATGRKDNRIQVFRESPVWIGNEKVYNIETAKYEFLDFRECLKEICAMDEDTLSISEIITENAWSPFAPVTRTTYFKVSDDELNDVPPPRTNHPN